MRAQMIMSAALFAATAAGAQTAQPKSDSSGCVTTPEGYECRKFSGDLSATLRAMHARMDSVMSKRAVLGIELRPTGTRRDTLGVFVESVTPKGPAENAGIVEGDRIAAINGVDVRIGAADVEDPYTNGIAAHRLTREVQKLTPGSRVTLRVYSGGRFRDVQVTAGRASDFMHDGGFGMMMGPGMMEFQGGPGVFRLNAMPGRVRMEGVPDGMGFEKMPRVMIENRVGDSARVIRLRNETRGTVQLRAPLVRSMAPMPPRAPMPAMRMLRPGTFRI